MKIRVTNYTFNAASKTVTFTDYASILLEAILMVVNTTTQEIIYNPFDTAKGGTVATNILTCEFDTTAMSNAHKLLIFYDDITHDQRVLGTDTYTEAATKGLTIGAVRRDADTTLVNTTNEIGPLQTDARGCLKVEAFSGETLPTSLATLPALVAGTANIGDVDVLTVPADPFGANADAAVAAGAVGSIQAKLRSISRDIVANIVLAAGSALIGKVNVVPQAIEGMTTYHLVSAATTNAANIKNAAGNVYGWFIYNSNAAARKVCFHNSASAPTAGASVFFSLVIPPLSGANVHMSNGIFFSAGIGISTVTGLPDNDSAAVALNDLIINIFYK